MANVENMLNQMSWEGIAACGATLAIVSGGFDLSQGSVYAPVRHPGVILVHSLSPFGAFASPSHRVRPGRRERRRDLHARINSFIATLASGYIILGLATIVTGGNVRPLRSPASWS